MNAAGSHDFECEEPRIKARFLEEYEKLINQSKTISGVKIKSARKYAALVNVHPTFITDLKAGRYKVNIRLLWLTKAYFPEFDYEYVLFGIRSIPAVKAVN